MNWGIALWVVFIAAFAVYFRLWWAADDAKQKKQDAERHKLYDELDALEKASTSPPTESMLKEEQMARDYARIKGSTRIRVTRSYPGMGMGSNGAEITEGTPLAFAVGSDGTGWVTIKKDDGLVVSVQHSIPPDKNPYGYVNVEARFV